MITRRATLGFLAATPFLSSRAMAATAEIFAVDNVAIRGADPVAFFTQAEAIIGSAQHSLMWKGAVWHFASAENRAAFEADPMKYAPQYGGYCAFAMSKGAIASSVPEAWTVYEGKLYLNYSTNVRSIWIKDIPGNVAKADANWPSILQS